MADAEENTMLVEEEATTADTDTVDLIDTVNTKKVKFPKFRCKKAVGKNSVQCKTCQFWVHVECQEISKELFSVLANPGKFAAYGSVCWNCDSCTASSAKLERRLVEFETRFKDVEHRVVVNEAAVHETNKRVEAVERSQARVEEEMGKERENIRQERNEELRERESRRKNVVIHRVEEAGEWARTGEERRNWDLESCENIFKELKLNMRAKEVIKFCRRVGERSETPRPMVVGFKREWQKEDLLDNARELKNTRFEEVTVAPDLTKEQRKEEAELVREAERRNERRTEDDRAKNLVWMVVGAKGEKRIIKGTAREQYQGAGLRGTTSRGGALLRGTGARGREPVVGREVGEVAAGGPAGAEGGGARGGGARGRGRPRINSKRTLEDRGGSGLDEDSAEPVAKR